MQPWNWTDLLLERISFVLLLFPSVWNKHIHITQTTVTNASSQTVKQTNPLLHTETQIKHKNKFCTHPPTLCLVHSVCEKTCLNYFCIVFCFYCPLQLESSLAPCINQCTAYTSTLQTQTHQCMGATCSALVPVLSVAVSWAWRAIWSPLPCHVPCEVLSAWPLWSPVATEGLQHSTSSPGSRPQKRKFGSFKWRGCSWAIYRTLCWSSATHHIPYEN